MITHIHAIAEEMKAQILAMGGNPTDPTVVNAYVKGCNIPRLIAKAIEDSADDEE
ncbi:hypothetical protein [Vibrio phage VpKK5]|uniref:hypothetical protein n=1 Tax=Vibrio phage VpKK5 TaxID=1538804 RepID=UPI0004F7332B|nr:hypothetical protein VC55_gp71 [Vibrio phage VpKK5]AIM40574.1 hypothetical protein [Vibrio phage VpKK5]